MNSTDLVIEYTRRKYDKQITPFTDGVGFSIIREYPRNSDYFRDSKLMLIRVAVENNKSLFFDINMVKDNESKENQSYAIQDGSEYRGRIVNLSSEKNEFFIEDTDMKITHSSSNEKLRLNDFVDMLAGNHLRGRNLPLKLLKRLVSNTILKTLFWICDKKFDHYARLISVFNREEKKSIERLESSDPFFGYFKIFKNLFIVSLIFTLFFSIVILQNDFLTLHAKKYFGDFSISNPLILIIAVITLHALEKVTNYLRTKIDEFEGMYQKHEQQKNLIQKIYIASLDQKYNLNLKLRDQRTS